MPKPFCGLGGMFFKAKIKNAEVEKKNHRSGKIQELCRPTNYWGSLTTVGPRFAGASVRNNTVLLDESDLYSPVTKKYQMPTPDSNDLCHSVPLYIYNGYCEISKDQLDCPCIQFELTFVSAE